MENKLEINSQDNKAHPENHPKNYKFRFGLLAILLGSSLWILARSLFDGSIGKPTPFIFPDRIELPKSQTKLEAQENIIDPQEFLEQPKYLFGKKYKYFLDGMPIDIDLRYVVGSEGELYWYFKGVTNIQISEEELRQKTVRKDPIGYHATFIDQNRAYLTACINPRGISTVTGEQFNDNASDRAMDRDVIISWLLGQKDLRDRRCLWTLMSTPITSNSNLNDTNRKLEKVWISWYEWWKPRFPQP